jgi:PAP2 superfamily
MVISRMTGTFRFLACSLLICAAEVYGSRPAFTQTTSSFVERTRNAEAPSGTPGFSDEARENQQQRRAQEPTTDAGCSVRGLFHETWSETSQFSRGLKAVPRGVIRPRNLEWELPILAATAVLIAKVDRPADNRIQSKSLQQTAGRWSNVGLGLELGSAALAYGIGCGKHHSYLRDTGFKALAAMGAAGTADLALKLTFDRQFPYTPNSTGKFWGGGRSFPSGHSATSFAFAAVVAHRYPKNKWVKWGVYALATGVSLSRYPAKKHYLSDILIGATLGYVTGTYLAEH